MAECTALRDWAEALPITAPAAGSDAYLTDRLRYMQAALPSRSVDEATGEKRAAVYLAMLRGNSAEAIAYMSDRAFRTCRWFPTLAECLDILAEYRAPESERAATLRICSAFAQDAFERWLMNVRAGQPVGDVPEHWMRIAVEQGAMRRLQDGSYVSRALYQGPVKAYVPDLRAVPADEPEQVAA